jgi:spermidine synthase
VPDPQTAQLNRFYTVEFFRSARDHLAPGGVLALQLRSSEETISPDLAEFLRCIQRTLKEVFPYTVAIPGETIHFFAATRPDVLTDNPQTILISRLRERKLQTQYVREYFIPFRMMPDRMAQVREQLAAACFHAHQSRFRAHRLLLRRIVLVERAVQGRLLQLVPGRSAHSLQRCHSPQSSVCPLTVAAILALVRSRAARPLCAACCVAATGFTLIALQILLLLAFQSIYGYVYHQLAILIGLGMAGIALGSWLGIRRAGSGRSPSAPWRPTQFCSRSPLLR